MIGKKILCRICKGDHFTTKCPYKDTLQPLDELNKDLEATKEAGKFDDLGLISFRFNLNFKISNLLVPVNEPTAPENSAGGKYIPPSMRAGAKPTTGDSYKERRGKIFKLINKIL